MKNIIPKLVLIFCLPLLAFSKNPESMPEYTIGKSLPDKTLKANESIFKFTFYTAGNLNNGQKIRLAYNGKKQTVSNDRKGIYELKLKPGKYKFQFFFNENFFEIYTDSISIKGGHKTPVFVYFTSSKEPVMAEKPVIYIYAVDTTDVTLKLNTKNKLSFTYPPYTDSWKVKATSSGNLITDKSVYPYLFWEGNIQLQPSEINTSKGFIVSKENLVSFFETKLTLMGLNAKEQTDFITYWCPRMSEHEGTFVHFLFNNDIEKYAALDVNPKPDNQFRVFMTWVPANKIDFVTDMQEQEIPSVKRNGLTVIEWGGAEINMPNP